MSRLDWQLAASPTSIDESGTDYLYRVGYGSSPVKSGQVVRRPPLNFPVRPDSIARLGHAMVKRLGSLFIFLGPNDDNGTLFDTGSAELLHQRMFVRIDREHCE
jgi:hypothetical protein